LDQLGCRFKYITKSAQEVNVENLIKIDSAFAALRMCEKVKNGFGRGFLLTYLPGIYYIYRSVLRHTYRSHFRAILTLSGSNDVFLQPLVILGGRDEIPPHLRGQISKKHFGGVKRRFQAELEKIL